MYGWRSCEWLKVFCVVGLLVVEVAAFGMGVSEVFQKTGEDFPYFVFDSGGDLIVGQSSGTNGVVRKFSGATGARKWEWHGRGGPLVARSSGGDVVAAQSVREPFATNVFVNLISGQTGSNLWETAITNVAANKLQWVCFDGEGDVVVTARTSGTNSHLTATKLDGRDGSLRWERLIQLGAANITRLTLNANGDVLVSADAGWSKDSDWSFRVVKLEKDSGRVLWEWKDLTNKARMLNQTGVDVSGNVILTGGCIPGSSYTTKIDGKDGTLIWCNVQPNSKTYGHSSVAVSNDDIISMGDGFDDSVGYFTYVVRYRAEDGAKIWEREFKPQPDGDGFPVALARDEDSDVVLVTDAKVRKLNAATGATIWEVTRSSHRSDDWVVIGPLGRFSYSRYQQSNRYDFGLFQIGPELRTQVMGNELEVGWEVENVGWRLERLSGVLDAGEWLAVEGSAGTNLVRVPKEGGTGMFRLVR